MKEIPQDQLYKVLVQTMDGLFPEICYYILDQDYRYVYFNPGHFDIMKKVWGVDIELGRNILDYPKKEDLKHKIKHAYDRCLKGESVDEIDQYPIHEESGSIERAKYYRPSRDEEGNVVGIVVFATEKPIRDQSTLERALLRNEKLMRETNALAKIGGWEMDLKTNTPYFTSGTFEIYDIENGEVPPLEKGISYYPPEAQKVLLAALDDVMKNHGSYDLQLDFISEKGTKKVVRTQGKVQLEDGEVRRLYGTIQDITDSNLVEKKLRKANDRFQAIYDRSPLPISMLRLNGEMLTVNPAFKRIIGYDRAEIRTIENWYSVAYKDKKTIDTAKKNWEEIKKGVENGQEDFDPIVRDITCKDGIRRKMELHFAIAEDFLIIVYIDITAKTEAQKALAMSELLYRNLYNLAPIMMDSLDKEGKIIHVNEYWLEKLGYTREEVVNRPIFDFIHPEDQEKSRMAFNRFMMTHVLTDFKFRFIKASGDEMDTLVNAIAEFDPSDQFSNTISVYSDITLQIKAEKKLIGANERYSKLINNIPGMVFRAKYDRVRSLEFLSKKSLEFIGKESSELLRDGYNLNNLIAEEDVAEVSKAIQFGLDTQQTYAVTYKLNEDLSANKWVLESGNLVEGLREEKFIEGSIFDITDRVGLEERLAATTMETEDRERTRISKEIHDGLQQTLSLSAMMFDNLKQASSLSKKDQAQLQEGIKHLNRAMEECREIAHRLMPASITDFGLILSIENLVRDLNHSEQIEVSFITNMTEEVKLKSTTETSLYRIVQEALNNVTKHSNAENCSIQLLKIGDKIQLSIEDDGVGFDLKGELKDMAKLGLKNMENRAISMSGKLMAESRKNGGSVIICTIPFPRNAAQTSQSA